MQTPGDERGGQVQNTASHAGTEDDGDGAGLGRDRVLLHNWADWDAPGIETAALSEIVHDCSLHRLPPGFLELQDFRDQLSALA